MSRRLLRSLPRSPFSTPLSGSARETEDRIRNIFQYKKKRPPILLLALACALALLCGGLVSCQPAHAESSILVMDTQYYDTRGNYIEIPMLALPGGVEPDEGVTAINQALAELKGDYAPLLSLLESGSPDALNAQTYPEYVPVIRNHCLLYPTQTDRYLSLVFFRDAYSTDLNSGRVLTLVYDRQEGRQLTLEDALSIAGQTEEELYQALAVQYAPELERQSQELTQNQAPENPPVDLAIQFPTLEGFRMGADGQPIFYLTARVDDREDWVNDAVSGSDNLYVWSGGVFSLYNQYAADGLHPLVPAEELLQMDPPLWCQWYFNGGEPEGGFAAPASASPETGGPSALSPDLNHNGIPEEVRLVRDNGDSEIQLWENGQQFLRLIPGDCLCTLDGRDYLLRFATVENENVPGSFQYHYELSDHSGEFGETIQWNSVSFDLNFYAPFHSFDPEGLAAFVEELDELLAHSVQLSEADGSLRTEPAPAVDLSWLDDFPDYFTPSAGMSLAETLTAFQEAMARAQTPVPLGATAALPLEEPLQMTFNSGAGAWATVLELRPDGSFTGDYHDSDLTVVSVCQFHGTFRDFVQLTDSSWLLTLDELVLDTERPVGEEWDREGYHYISSTPYGFTNEEGNTLSSGAQFILYTPEATGHTPGTELYGAYDFWTWWPERHTLHSASDTLRCYGLYNLEGGTGFFS